MSKRVGAWVIASALSLVSAAAWADVAGSPPTGGGGAGGGGAGGGTTTSSSSTTTTGSSDKGGCSAATSEGAQGSAALLVGLGLLFAVPAMRRRRDRKGDRR